MRRRYVNENGATVVNDLDWSHVWHCICEQLGIEEF